MKNLLNKLNQPYPLEKDFLPVLKRSLGIGLFIFLFSRMFLSAPLNKVPSPNIEFILAGFGFITFMTILIIRYVIPSLLPRLFNEKNWKIKNEILTILLIIFSIGFLNLLYGYWGGYLSFSLIDIIQVQSGTLTVGIIPVTVVVILNQNRLLKKHLKSALGLNTIIESGGFCPEETQNPFVLLHSENGKDSLEIKITNLLCIKSVDNYVEIYWIGRGSPEKYLLRNTLTRIEDMVSDFHVIFRCHRSYLVNINQISKVTGNSRGYLLQLPQIDEEIPVARRLSRQFKELLSPDFKKTD